MRRLLIGDHNQLPPFDTDRIAEFLADQTRVKLALAESDPVIGNIFRDFGLDDLKEAVEDDSVLSETCASARRMLLLFESLVTSELDRQKRSDQRRRRVATELLQQHRMHPAIATVISECFYDGTLTTPAERKAEFDSEQPPFTITDGRLPASPIVFVDLPYVQREGSASEQRPTYHNPAELKAVLSVLGMLNAAPKSRPNRQRWPFSRPTTNRWNVWGGLSRTACRAASPISLGLSQEPARRDSKAPLTPFRAVKLMLSSSRSCETMITSDAPRSASCVIAGA
jgi:hypothetical protein